MFKTVGIISKAEHPGVRETLERLLAFLQQRNIRILADNHSCLHLPHSKLSECALPVMGAEADAVICVGGDGTLLGAARSLAPFDVPLMGINLGRLGFLVDIGPDKMQQALTDIFDGHHEMESRSLLKLQIGSDEQIHFSDIAFNDVVLHKWNTARMIEFEISIDGHFVESQRSDGLIVSTPTGSTAYALSGGGPLLHPALAASVIVPICTHTLSNRPIVLSNKSHIQIRVCSQYCESVRISCDGQNSYRIQEDERLSISHSRHHIRLIHPAGHDHFDIMRAKLGWGGKTVE
ncbi:MAG: NAD(+) kinase [gamma proteobacterium symbiont of Bathyaustriella thionipta]|nr:NAD(+) kinase [gamma proteobacterium symbiont of Bathyaustriella thionipta]